MQAPSPKAANSMRMEVGRWGVALACKLGHLVRSTNRLLAFTVSYTMAKWLGFMMHEEQSCMKGF